MVNKRKIIHILLISVLIITSLPIQSFAQEFANQTEYYQYLESIGYPTTSDKGDANFITYRDYGKIVYGYQHGDKKNDSLCGNTSEYRNLGYDKDGNVVTNECFPKDADSGKHPKEFNYINVEDALISWSAIRDSNVKNHIKNSAWTGNGATSNDPMKYSYIGSESKVRIEIAPTWCTQGSVYTNNKGASGKIYYATFTVPSIGGNCSNLLSGRFETNNTSYTIEADQYDVSILYSVYSTLTMGTNMSKAHLTSLAASYKGNTTSYPASTSQFYESGSTLTKWTNGSLNLSREQYNVGTHTIKLEGDISYNTTFGDRGTGKLSKTITLVVKEPSQPIMLTNGQATPSQKNFASGETLADVPVKVKVTGKINALKDASRITKYELLARKEDETAVQTKTYTGTEAQAFEKSWTFDFTIPKSKFSTAKYTQNFVVRARAYYQNGKVVEVVTSTDSTSTVVYPPTVTPPPEPEIPIEEPPEPEPTNLPPSVQIYGPDTVRAGDYVCLMGSASDPDGTIVSQQWFTPNANGTLTGSGGCIWYSEPGNETVITVVEDDKGAQAGDDHNIEVTLPYPRASFSVTGTLKENRKVMLTNTSDSPTFYPIDYSKSYWEIKALDPLNSTNIRYKGSLSDSMDDVINALFKKQGQYQATIYIENTYGLSDSYTKTFTITEDLIPVVDFSTVTTIYRDDENIKATIKVSDTSYSIDDEIEQRIYQYKYDSNNDGSFNDESWVLINSENLSYVEFKVDKVGKYLISLQGIEKFGQPTIEEFVTPEDRRRDDTANKLLSEKVVEARNLAPTAGYEVGKRKMVKLNFVIGDTLLNQSQIESKINSIMKPMLNEEQISLEIEFMKQQTGAPINKLYYVEENNSSLYYGSLIEFDPSTQAYRVIENTQKLYRIYNVQVSRDGMVYYKRNNSESTLYEYNPITNISRATELNNVSYYHLGLDNEIYYFDGYQISHYNFKTKVRKAISNIVYLNQSWLDLTVTKEGTVYFLAQYGQWGSESFYKYDPLSGVTTKLIDNASCWNFIKSHPNGKIYYVCMNSSNYDNDTLYEYNPATNTTTIKAYTYDTRSIEIAPNGIIYTQEAPGSSYIMKSDPNSNIWFTTFRDDATLSSVTSYGDITYRSSLDGRYLRYNGSSTTYMPRFESNMEIRPSGVKYPTYLGGKETIQEVANKIKWENGKYNYYVSVSDKSIQELSTYEGVSKLVQQLSNEEVGFIGLGRTNTNLTQYNNVIKANENGGFSIDNLNFDNALSKTTQYLIDEITARKTIDLQVSVGESTYSKEQVEAKINEILKPKLLAEKIRYELDISNQIVDSIHIDNPWELVGTYSNGQTISLDTQKYEYAFYHPASNGYGNSLDGTVSFGTYASSAYATPQRTIPSGVYKLNGTYNTSVYRKPKLLSEWTTIGAIAPGQTFYMDTEKYEYAFTNSGSNAYILSTTDGTIASGSYASGALATPTKKLPSGTYKVEATYSTNVYVKEKNKGSNFSINESDETIFSTIIHDPSLSEEGQVKISNELKDKEATLISLGTSTNQSQFNQVITDMGEGTFIYNSNLEVAVNEMANYIIEQLTNNQYKIDLVLGVGDTVHNDKAILESKLNSIVLPKLNENKISIKSIKFNSGKFQGTKNVGVNIKDISGGKYIKYNNKYYLKLTGENSRVLNYKEYSSFYGNIAWSGTDPGYPKRTELEGGVWTNTLRKLYQPGTTTLREYWTGTVSSSDSSGPTSGWVVNTSGSFSSKSLTSNSSLFVATSLSTNLYVIGGDGNSEATAYELVQTDITSFQLEPSKNELFTTILEDKAFSEDGKSVLVGETLKQNSNIIGLGTSSNQSDFESIVQENMERGTFINNSDLDTALNNLADYILQEMIKKSNMNEVYLTLEEQAVYYTTYSDAENDPKFAERWRYDHNPGVFENNNGLANFNLKNLSAPITKFDHVGRYQTIHAARDNPVYWNDDRFDNYRLWSKEVDNFYIYVHRKPIPNFVFAINSSTGAYTLTNKAYDLDKQSIDIGYGGGIKELSYQWREKGSISWTEGLPTSPLARKEYEVKQTVTDFQNASESTVRVLDATGVNKAPIADFIPIPNTIIAGESVSLKNMSYDPNGDPLTYEWWVKGKTEADSQYVLFSTVFEPTRQFDIVGNYTFRLRARDSLGAYSNFVTKDVTVLPDNAPPTAGFTHLAYYFVGDTIEITSTASDPDGDLLTYNYRIESPSGTISSDTVPNPSFLATEGGLWKVTQTVSDGTEEDTAYSEIPVYDVSIDGMVRHTTLWEQHRLDYNASKIDPSEHRASNVFFPGEKFILSSDVVNDSMGALYVGEVDVNLVDHSLTTNLIYPGTGLTWNGEMWNESMMKWQDQSLSFVFTAYYYDVNTNALITTRSDIVPVSIDDDSYWRQRRRH